MSGKSPSELLSRHEGFLNLRPTDRPLLGFWRGGYYPVEQCPHGVGAWREGEPLAPSDVRFEAFREDYERLYRLHAAARDDFFFVASAYWGIPWMEAILGCPVFAGRETCWSKADAGASERLAKRPFNLEHNPWFARLAEFTERLISLAGGRFPVCAPLLRGPGDCAAALFGAETFISGLMDNSETMRQALEHCSDARSAVIEALHAILPSWQGTYAAGGYTSKMWCGRRIGYHQEDSAAFLNPRLFKEFLLPLHRHAMKVAEVNFIHLHSACLYPVEILLQDGCYDVLEVNLDHKGAGPDAAKLAPTFRAIQERGVPLILWGHLEMEEWAFMLRQLNPTGLSLQPAVADESELAALEQLFNRIPL